MKLRVAVIGLGRIGSSYDRGRPGRVARSHVGAILSNPKYELIAVCDSNPESVEGFQRDWGKRVCVYRSVTRLLSKTHADVIVVATPPETHRRVLEKVVGARPRLIFCEKPFCARLGDAYAVRDRAERYRVPVVVNYHRRWDVRFQRLAARFRKMGAPAFVQVVYRKGLMNYGSHTVDLLQQFFGFITYVEAEPMKSRLADPSYSATVTFASGLKARISGVDGAEYELMDFEIFYKTAKFRLALGGYSVEVFRPQLGAQYRGYLSLPESGKKLARGPVSGLSEAYREIPKILGGTSKVDFATATSAIDVQRVLDAIRRSARTRKGVRL